MIAWPNAVTIYVFRAPVDMRKSFDTLAALATLLAPRELLRGAVFLFVGRDRRRAKVLFFDGTGVCLLAKRLEKGRFANLWSDSNTPKTLSASELALFLEGSEHVGRVPLSPPSMDLSRDLNVSRDSFHSPLDRASRESY